MSASSSSRVPRPMQLGARSPASTREHRDFHACGRHDCHGCLHKTVADVITAMGGEPSERAKKVVAERAARGAAREQKAQK